MKKSSDIRLRIRTLETRLSVMYQYAALVREREDWHGVMDASADIRELNAEIACLKWVLGAVSS